MPTLPEFCLPATHSSIKIARSQEAAIVRFENQNRIVSQVFVVKKLKQAPHVGIDVHNHA